MNKENIILIIAITLISLGVNGITKKYHRTDIEIYTNTNIYYIEGLKVSNENNDQIYIFNDKQSLKEYIGTVTAEETNQ